MCWVFVAAVSGRSSVIGDVTVDSTTTGAHSDVGSIGGGVAGGEASVSGAVASDVESLEADYDFNRHVHVLRLRILDKLIYYLPELHEVGGVRAIPFMQVCCFIMKRENLRKTLYSIGGKCDLPEIQLRIIH